MTQLTLLSAQTPPATDGIVIHCGDVSMVLEARGAALVMADPPWSYNVGCLPGSVGRGGAKADVYAVLGMSEIITTLDRSFDSAADDAYLFCWCTWPMLAEFIAASGTMRWRYLSGGSWHKTGGLGVGFHLRGDSEPWLLFAKGKPTPTSRTLSNAYASPRTSHSEKPVAYLREVIGCLTEPDALVVSVYSGLCPEARAAKATGRRLIGAEIDPERHATALGLLAGYR